jgi:hypothetical protein
MGIDALGRRGDYGRAVEELTPISGDPRDTRHSGRGVYTRLAAVVADLSLGCSWALCAIARGMERGPFCRHARHQPVAGLKVGRHRNEAGGN